MPSRTTTEKLALVIHWTSFALLLMIAAAFVLWTMIHHEVVDGDFLKIITAAEDYLQIAILVVSIFLYILIKLIRMGKEEKSQAEK